MLDRPDRPATTRLPLPTLTKRAIALRCVVCGKDEPFTGIFTMRHSCRRCGYVYARERGYFLGSAEMNFWVTFCFLVPLALGSYLLLDRPGHVPIYACLAFTVAFPIWFFRYSKALYMGIDLWLDPPTEADFVVRNPEPDPAIRRKPAA